MIQQGLADWLATEREIDGVRLAFSGPAITIQCG